MKVVVVDDSAASRNFYRMLLGHAYRLSPPGRGLAAAAVPAGSGPSAGTWNNGRRAAAELSFSGSGICELNISEAATGMEGLALCRSTLPDCVLLDYKLPDMTGLEFLDQLGEGSTPDAPAYAVVMLTGLATERIAVEALQAGAQDYLLKDRVSAESLRLALDKATGKVRLIRALKEERDRLAASLAEKEVLLKEVHHRVKNNLQVIVSLLRLQAQVIHDGRLADALRESQDRVESMALIHEQLYETTDLREVDLARHASLLVAKLFSSYGVAPARIECRVNIAALPLPVDQAIPAGLILNELISNALKHAFPGDRHGLLELNGGRVAGRIYFEVRDNGVGIPPEIDAARPGSLGLEIVNILTRQLKGTVAMERRSETAGTGTAFRVEFPAV